MTSITQKINSVNGGISQQPDELKLPGQVVSAKNVLPDVTNGLQKRPGSKLIASLSNGTKNSYTTGKWFSYYRDENEQYIGQIIRRKNSDGTSHADDGKVRMWKCSDGSEMDVVGDTTAITSYLQHTNDDDIQTLTLNDFTFINNRTIATGMDSTEANVRPPEAFVELKQIKYASQYALNLFDDEEPQTVTTATRIEITRAVDSSNSCRLPTVDTDNNGTNDAFAASGANRGAFPPSGTEPGTGNFTHMCDSIANYADLDSKKKDSYCPNVDTRIFKISHGGLINSTDKNGVSSTYTVVTSSGNASDRKELFFRITTTGQSVVEGESSTPKYYCRYTTTHDLLHGGSGWQVGDTVQVWMKNARYDITIKEVSTAQIQANRGLIRPTPTSFDTKTTVTAESILANIKTAIDNYHNSNFNEHNNGQLNTAGSYTSGVKIIGNGIYITRKSGNFNISTPVGDLLNVLANEVQDVADLPKQCKHGYIVKILNNANDEDDYYVKFIGVLKAGGNPDDDEDYLDGDGVWQECAEPGRKIAFDKAKMPIQLVRTSATQFTLSQIDYENCSVGSPLTAPKPSFISTVADQDGDKATVNRYINKMIFFRNRLVFLSDENVIMSRPGDFFNFWPKSAIAASAEDVIDLSCSSEYPAIVYDGIQVNTGLVLFTKNQQFMLTTDSDVLSPVTAKINSLSTYNFNHQTNPISLGTTIAFLDNAGLFTRMFEMASVLREGEPVILEQSKLISSLFPKNINLIANSRENSFIVFAEKDGTTLYGYKYFTSGEKRLQQAWITWELSGNIQYLCMLDDAVYAVVRSNGIDVMQKFSLKLSGDTNESVAKADETYRVHLDNISSVTTSSTSYNASTGKTVFAKPNGYTSSKQLVAYDIDAGNNVGTYVQVTVNGSNLEIQGDWSDQTFLIGYLYDMEIELPKFFVTQQSGDRIISDVQSNLIIHRIKFNFGPLGLYKTTLKRIGKPDYVEEFESTFADEYLANQVAVTDSQEVTLPIYERNKNYTLTITTTHPAPASLYSLAWEGDYSNTFYKRV